METIHLDKITDDILQHAAPKERKQTSITRH
jgi:hypothetical protein